MADHNKPRLEGLERVATRYSEARETLDKAEALAEKIKERKEATVQDVIDLETAIVSFNDDSIVEEFFPADARERVQRITQYYQDEWANVTAADYVIIPEAGVKSFYEWKEYFGRSHIDRHLPTPFASLPDVYTLSRDLMEECVELCKTLISSWLFPLKSKGVRSFPPGLTTLAAFLDKHMDIYSTFMAEDQQQIRDMSKPKKLLSAVRNIQERMNQDIVVDTELKYGERRTNTIRDWPYASAQLYSHDDPIDFFNIPEYQRFNIPEYQRSIGTGSVEGWRLSDVTKTLEGKHLVDFLLFGRRGKVDDETIFQPLEFMSGKQRDRITLFSPTEEERRKEPHCVASLGYHGRDEFCISLSTKRDYLAHAIAIDQLKQQWYHHKRKTNDQQPAHE